MNKMKTHIRCLTLAILLLIGTPSMAQYAEIFRPSIKTLQTVADQRWTDMPIIALNSHEQINIDFDDFTHETQRYAYRIEHCDAHWCPTTSLFESDYIEGFAEGNLIDDQEQSLNTNTLYTHYHFCIPNEQCRIKLSGNYRVTVYDENNDNEIILKTYFMVAEPAVSISMSVTSNTDRDVNGRHQQIDISLQFSNIHVTDWQREINTFILQNGRWSTAVANPMPQFIKPDGIRWAHCQQLIFDGGNEYRKFELLDVNHANMGIEHTDWDNKDYHAYLWPDEPQPNYVYDEDANGAFFIRNSDNREINYTSEYQLVHFALQIPRSPYPIYLNGKWTHDCLRPQYQMRWNEKNQRYEACILLKQGYYNYQYVQQLPSGKTTFLPSEGNFYQTENQYTALVYYHGQSSRYDRLVGASHLSTHNR